MARIVYTPNRVDLYFPYDFDLLDRLRVSIPLRCRHYDSTRNMFSVWDPYVAKAAAIFTALYPDVETVGLPPQDPSNGPSEAAGSPETNETADSDSRYLFVVSDAPEAVYRAAYKALVRLYHPDVNAAIGGNRAIQDLNNAWERIRSRKGWTP